MGGEVSRPRNPLAFLTPAAVARAESERRGAPARALSAAKQAAARIRPDNLTGEQFGRLTVMGVNFPSVFKVSRSPSLVWDVRCDCGRESGRSRASLDKGRKLVCGPLHGRANKVHVQDPATGKWSWVLPENK